MVYFNLPYYQTPGIMNSFKINADILSVHAYEASGEV
jgi:hypothetical protein